MIGLLRSISKNELVPNKQLVNQFKDCPELFIEGKLNLLDDHALRGKLTGKRAFSVTDDIRDIYTELNDVIVFLDIGNHGQVYR